MLRLAGYDPGAQLKEIRFVTYSLRYNRCQWVTVDGLLEHWQSATVKANLKPGEINVVTENVSGFTLSFDPGRSPFRNEAYPIPITINGSKLDNSIRFSDLSWSASFRLHGTTWKLGARPAPERRTLIIAR